MRSDREPGGAYAFPDDPQYAGSGMRLRYGIPALSGGKEGLGAAVKGAYALNVLGLNVTVPYKMAVIPYLVSTDKLAADVESVNTLVRTEGGYRGYNTDMSGLYRAMQEDKVEIKDRDVVILGAGGVGRAIAFLCAQKGAERVTILNRSVDKACSVAEEVKEKTGYQAIHARTIAEAGRLDGRDYLAIQATSVGLFPDSEKAAVEDSAFYEKVGTGYDLIYRPAETKFMRLVKENGKEAYNGLKMLLYQGVEAFELWNDVAVSKETADRIYQRMEQELSGK